jgi:hypothetical protein
MQVKPYLKAFPVKQTRGMSGWIKYIQPIREARLGHIGEVVRLNKQTGTIQVKFPDYPLPIVFAKSELESIFTK